MYAPFRFDPVELPESARALRAEVRAFLSGWVHRFDPRVRGLSWMGFDRDFSRAVAAQGWIGMTWPAEYGGGARSMLDRYVVIEEMLAAGAPVGAHWIADRQSGPLILKLGTEAQKARLIPEIVRGDACFCIGLSEPQAGSDLAAVRTRIVPDGDGWRLNGRKIWTTNAHRSDYMIALVRSSGGPEDRHAGLSQVIVPMKAPGVHIREIEDMAGDAHFNEVTFDDVELGPDALIGVEGQGWAQATAELAFERSGPDRFLSAFPLLEAVTGALDPACEKASAAAIGNAAAEIAVLRQMSVSIAGMLDRGEVPNTEAAVVKEAGVAFEQSTPDLARALLGSGLATGTAGDLSALYASVLQLQPTFSLRGGTREIVRGIMARGLGLR
ncbi:acyl-CoA dehydrogenase family protein [Chachezhania sediminis]|uniref:acyl-CoA dehydrogenase family protein n=1 Tax=Chachezhania sediminis TaxID=2599291 RepID=UPI00131E9510|nr:acyl-CoA dehydrogenase family protein [Chachezhania sediminis]